MALNISIPDIMFAEVGSWKTDIHSSLKKSHSSLDADIYQMLFGTKCCKVGEEIATVPAVQPRRNIFIQSSFEGSPQSIVLIQISLSTSWQIISSSQLVSLPALLLVELHLASFIIALFGSSSSPSQLKCNDSSVYTCEVWMHYVISSGLVGCSHFSSSGYHVFSF